MCSPRSSIRLYSSSGRQPLQLFSSGSFSLDNVGWEEVGTPILCYYYTHMRKWGAPLTPPLVVINTTSASAACSTRRFRASVLGWLSLSLSLGTTDRIGRKTSPSTTDDSAATGSRARTGNRDHFSARYSSREQEDILYYIRNRIIPLKHNTTVLFFLHHSTLQCTGYISWDWYEIAKQ